MYVFIHINPFYSGRLQSEGTFFVPKSNSMQQKVSKSCINICVYIFFFFFSDRGHGLLLLLPLPPPQVSLSSLLALTVLFLISTEMSSDHFRDSQSAARERRRVEGGGGRGLPSFLPSILLQKNKAEEAPPTGAFTWKPGLRWYFLLCCISAKVAAPAAYV